MSGSSSSVLAERLNRTLTTHNENLDVAVAPVAKLSSSSTVAVTASADDSNDDVLLACIANDDADVTQLPLLPRTVYAHRSVDSAAVAADVDVDVDARARAMTMYCAVASASDRQALIGELDQLSSKCGSFVSLFALELRLIRL